ncbi:MAG: signal peptidase I [Patescibacteria group bacterium]
MQILKKLLFNFTIYVAIVIGLLFGLPKFLSWSLNTPYPMAAITSNSMWPVFTAGTLVFIQGVPKEDLKTGDIIVWRNAAGGGFTIHRIARLNETTLVTKGDANFTEDEPVAYERVVGRAWGMFGRPFKIPYIGSVTMMAQRMNYGK